MAVRYESDSNPSAKRHYSVMINVKRRDLTVLLPKDEKHRVQHLYQLAHQIEVYGVRHLQERKVKILSALSHDIRSTSSGDISYKRRAGHSYSEEHNCNCWYFKLLGKKKTNHVTIQLIFTFDSSRFVFFEDTFTYTVWIKMAWESTIENWIKFKSL